MAKIDVGRILQVLNEYEDKKYYYGAMLFSELAEEKWIKERNVYNVKHGYVHISQLIKFTDSFFETFSNEQIINLLGPSYLFVLISSIYCHDLGMQDYFDMRLPYIDKNKVLGIEELESIRINHADTISDVLSNLDTESDLEVFFGDSLFKIYNQIEGTGIERHQIADLILNKKRIIAISCCYHNKDIGEVRLEVDRLCKNEKLCKQRGDENFDKLIFVVSLLQVVDSLDMSINRINVSDFYAELTDIKNGNTEHIGMSRLNTLKRKLLCFIIDKVKIENKSENIVISFEMSLPEKNITDNYVYIRECKKKYFSRLKRNEKDCLVEVERFLNKEIVINIEANPIIVTEEKRIIPSEFFELNQDHKFKNLENLLESALGSISKDCVFLYVKLFSQLSNAYWGGVAICDSPEHQKYIESLYFYHEDWCIDLKEDCVLKKSDFRDMIRQGVNIKEFKKYSIYFEYCKNKKIKSELYFVIKYDSRVIGFVNVHFEKTLTESEKMEKCEQYRNEVSPLGLKIVQYHQEFALPEYEKIIKSCLFLPKPIMDTFVKSFRSLLSGLQPENISDIKLSDINSFLDIKSDSIKNKNEEMLDSYTVRINYGLFTWLFNFLFNTMLPQLAEVSFQTTYGYDIPHFEIIINIKRYKNLMPARYLEQAELYLKALDLLPYTPAPIKELEYLFAFKSLIILFGGKINVSLSRNHEELTIHTLLPLKNSKRSMVCNL